MGDAGKLSESTSATPLMRLLVQGHARLSCQWEHVRGGWEGAAGGP